MSESVFLIFVFCGDPFGLGDPRGLDVFLKVEVFKATTSEWLAWGISGDLIG